MHSLLLAFDRDSQDFRDGFELGCLWRRADSDEGEFEQEVHAVNAEMVLRIAEATHRSVTWDELDNGWCFAYFSERADA